MVAELDQDKYRRLKDLLLCRITLFNCRRAGECSSILVNEFKNVVKPDSGNNYNLTQLEQNLLNR